jgi:hypothetical protein
MVAIQRRLHGLAFVHDLPKRSAQRPTNLRPIRHVRFRMGEPQCLLDGCEVGGLPGFNRPIGIATKRGPAKGRDQGSWTGFDIKYRMNSRASSRCGAPLGIPIISPPNTWASRTGPRHPAYALIWVFPACCTSRCTPKGQLRARYIDSVARKVLVVFPLARRVSGARKGGKLLEESEGLHAALVI